MTQRAWQNIFVDAITPAFNLPSFELMMLHMTPLFFTLKISKLPATFSVSLLLMIDPRTLHRNDQQYTVSRFDRLACDATELAIQPRTRRLKLWTLFSQRTIMGRFKSTWHCKFYGVYDFCIQEPGDPHIQELPLLLHSSRLNIPNTS